MINFFNNNGDGDNIMGNQTIINVGGRTIINGVDVTNGNANTVKGNGIPKTVNIEPQPFDSINVSGSIQVDFAIGDTSSVEITADSNLVEFVDLNYFGATLDIGIKNNSSFSTNNPMKVKIVHPHLKEIDISGSSVVEVTRLKEAGIEVDVSGSGKIELRGTADNARLEVSGSGKINAVGLEVRRVKAKISGSGSIQANAQDSVSAKVSGSGNITVHGNPAARDSKCSGSGKIHFV